MLHAEIYTLKTEKEIIPECDCGTILTEETTDEEWGNCKECAKPMNALYNIQEAIERNNLDIESEIDFDLADKTEYVYIEDGKNQIWLTIDQAEKFGEELNGQKIAEQKFWDLAHKTQAENLPV